MSLNGLYDAAFEHDSCGVAFVARLDGTRSHETVERGLAALAHLEHRGAEGADAGTGDGAGILVQLPDAFLRAVVRSSCRRPAATALRSVSCRRSRFAGPSSSVCSRRRSSRKGTRCSGWRDVPVEPAVAGEQARRSAPAIRQLFVARAGFLRRRRARTRPQAVRDPEGRRAGRRAGARPPELLGEDARLQGDVDSAAARAASIRTSATSGLRARLHSSTRGSARTPSRAGSSRTPIG